MGPKQYCYDVCYEFVFVGAFCNMDTPGCRLFFPRLIVWRRPNNTT